MAEEEAVQAKGDVPSQERTRKGGRPGVALAKKWEPVFLERLAELGVVSHAAAAAGVSRQVVYRARESDLVFAEAFADACEVAADVLEREAFRRAVEGVEEPLVSGGKVIGSVTRYSDRLLEFLLKARRPQRFSDRHRYDAGEDPTARLAPAHGAGTRGGLSLLAGLTIEDLHELAGSADVDDA